jgi:glycosyltransferase involved in cell wall biosynthesis
MGKSMDKISIVVPCYNEEKALPYFYDEIKKVANKMKEVIFEIIFVNDGSKDNTLNVIKDITKRDKCIRYISFSRNFGKEAAMYAGFKEATGDYIATMDADLQDPPELLEDMLRYIKEEGYDSVATKRKNRKGEPFIKSIFSVIYYKVIRKITKLDIADGARNYRLMTRQMLNSVLEMCEYNRYLNGIYAFVGYNTKWLEYNNKKRIAGKTNYSFFKLVSYALEAITSFSAFPLRLSAVLGMCFCLTSFIFIIFIIIRTLAFGDPTSGWPSMVCIVIFVSGIQLFFLGIIGEYLSKTYLETKKRPVYIVKETEKDLI